MTKTPAEPHAHPAKFSDEVLDALGEITKRRVKRHEKVLDPFAGIGRIHHLADAKGWDSVGVEIEPEWADAHARTICGDSTKLTKRFKRGQFVAVITSPVYGNRMSDSHDAKEKCKPCGGTGFVNSLGENVPLVELVCEKCGGVGRRNYKRNTYKHTLARIDPTTGKVDNLHPNNTGAMPFREGPCKYKDVHRAVWGQVAEIRPRWIFLNVSDFIKGKNADGSDHVMAVTDWHVSTIEELGYTEVERIEVKTKRNRHGKNGERRVEHESVIAFRLNGSM